MKGAIKSKLKFFIIMIFISIFAVPAHEFGHFLGFVLSGIEVKGITFNGVQTVNGASNLISAFGGPFLSIALALFGLAMLYKSNKHKDVWGSFSFIMCLTRINSYLVILVTSFFIKNKNLFTLQDEGFMANFLHIPLWSFYAIFIVLFIAIIFLLIYNMRKSNINYIKVLGYSFICYTLIMFFEVGVLDNILFH